MNDSTNKVLNHKLTFWACKIPEEEGTTTTLGILAVKSGGSSNTCAENLWLPCQDICQQLMLCPSSLQPPTSSGRSESGFLSHCTSINLQFLLRTQTAWSTRIKFTLSSLVTTKRCSPPAASTSSVMTMRCPLSTAVRSTSLFNDCGSNNNFSLPPILLSGF